MSKLLNHSVHVVYYLEHLLEPLLQILVACCDCDIDFRLEQIGRHVAVFEALGAHQRLDDEQPLGRLVLLLQVFILHDLFRQLYGLLFMLPRLLAVRVQGSHDGVAEDDES